MGKCSWTTAVEYVAVGKGKKAPAGWRRKAKADMARSYAQ